VKVSKAACPGFESWRPWFFLGFQDTKCSGYKKIGSIWWCYGGLPKSPFTTAHNNIKLWADFIYTKYKISGFLDLNTMAKNTEKLSDQLNSLNEIKNSFKT